MNFTLIDSHAHLTDVIFQEDLPQVLARAEEKGVGAIINVGFDLTSSFKSVSLAESYEPVYCAVGIHPHDAANLPQDYLLSIRDLAGGKKVVAIGEIGLDFYRNLSPAQIQKRVFREQISLAKEMNLPIIVHDRDAHQDIITILEEEKAAITGGVMHCFSGDVPLARRCLKLGFYISIAGPVTFNRPGALAEVARQVPLDRLMLETDCPYLAPHPYRGRRNEPGYLYYIAEQVARLRGEELSTVAEATAANTRRLFRF